MVTREVVAELSGHSAKVNVLDFSADGRRLLSGADDRTAIIWDLESREPIATHQQDDGYVWTAAFLGDDEVVFGGTNDQLMSWAYESEHAPTSFFSSEHDITSVQVSPDGSMLACTTADGGISLIDSATKAVHGRSTGHVSDAMSTAFTADGQTIVSAGSDGKVAFWSLRVFEPTVQIDAHEAHVHSIAFSPDGSQLATGSWDHTVKLWTLRE